MANHFKDAERYLRSAESAFKAADELGFPEGNLELNRAHYHLQFANTHTLLAQVQAQSVGFDSVGRMADAVTVENKENK